MVRRSTKARMAGNISNRLPIEMESLKPKGAGQTKKVPIWLRRLDQMRRELRGVTYPQTADEGFRIVAMLSAASLRMLEDQVRSTRPRAGDERIRSEVYQLMARWSAADARQARRWREGSARYFKR